MFIVGENYRLQNMEYGTFLEMGQGRENAPLTLRVAKEPSETQQWSLVDAPIAGRFYLRNVGWSGAADGGGRAMTYQFQGNGSQICVTYDVNRALPWVVDRDEMRDEYTIRFSPSGGAWYFLGATGSEAACYVNDNTSTSQTAPNNLRWKLIAVWPSIPRDTYIIRSFSGLGLYMAIAAQPPQAGANLATLSDEEELNFALSVNVNQDDAEHQLWKVEPLPNGQVHLRNVQITHFLVTQKNEVTYGDLVGKQTAGVPWQLRSIGGFGYSISIQVPEVTNVPLALTVLPRNGRSQVFLSPLSNSRNQLWTFDPVGPPIRHLVGVAGSGYDGKVDQ